MTAPSATHVRSDQVWQSGVLSLTVSSTGNEPGKECLQVEPYGFRRCILVPLSEAVPVLRVDAVDDLAEPAFMLWGAVPSSVAELEVRSDDFDKISTDITHPGYQGVEFVVYVAPLLGTSLRRRDRFPRRGRRIDADSTQRQLQRLRVTLRPDWRRRRSR